MGFATGYELQVWLNALLDLRKTGFQGSIILAESYHMDSESEEYLEHNVILKKVEYVNCTAAVLDVRSRSELMVERY
jgi:hypothetical protein